MEGCGLARRAGAACLMALAVLGAATACARQGAPPGGPPDRIPPYIVATTPDTFETVEPFGSSIRVEFNERISERVSGGWIDNAVEISPRTGDVRVRHRRQRIDISMAGGFVEGLVYRVTVLPVIQDMFGNALREPFEFFFSTGPEFTDNALAGALEDRITGQPVASARVDAWMAGVDSILHTTVSDDDGIFALRRMPAGTYQVRAYVDVNRTYEPDFIELQGSTSDQALGAADTLLAFLDMLQPDTTPARLIGVDGVDSLTLELGFDDFLDPDSALDAVTVTVAPDSTQPDLDGAPAVTRLLHAHNWVTYADSVRAVADSLAALADTTGAEATPADPLPLPGPSAPTQGLPAEEGRLRPSQLIYAVLDGPMVPAALYRVTVTGVTNLAGLRDGGGDAAVAAPEPPPPDTVVIDSLAVPNGTGAPTDSAGVPEARALEPAPGDSTSASPAPDTTGVPPDTTGVPADTAAVSPDTAAVPATTADTAVVQPDTAVVQPATPLSAMPTDLARRGRLSLRDPRAHGTPRTWLGMRRLRD